MNTPNKILLISDNEETARYFMEQLLITEAYSVTVERTAIAGLQGFKNSDFDLVVLKWDLPDMECAQLVTELRSLNCDVPVMVLFDESRTEKIQQLANLGIFHFISKPFSAPAVSFMVKKGLELRQLMAGQKRLVSILKEQNSGLQKQNSLLAKRIEESTRSLSRLYEDLRSTYLRTIRSLAQAIDARDHYTHSHSENVSLYSVAIARQLGYTVKEIETLREASELHDIGKIGISDLILLKPSSLTKEEWDQIRKHPETGALILEPLTFLGEAIELVRQHHEHYDGSGYPLGLKGEQILLGARILHVADAYEAMVSARSYRKIPLTREQAIAELMRNASGQFDPRIVEAFLRIVNEL